MNFLAVSVDPGDGPDVLRRYQQANGYPWMVAPGNRETAERYNVLSTMGKYGIDRQGTIVIHGGHLVEDARTWEQRFEELARR